MRRMGRLLLLLTFVTALLTAQAQETGSSIPLGTLTEGRLDDETPRRVYFFDGSRGEVVRLRLTAINGTLDPVLSVFDNVGNVLFSQDDDEGTRNIDTTLRLDTNGRYYIVVGRFGYALGRTNGDYTFALERVGVLSEQGSTLRYGIPVANTITNTQPQWFYTFQANSGDILNIEMIRTSGTLDPYVQVVDSNRFLIADNDDALGENTRNARIDNLLIPEDGTYIVIATRYGQDAGETVGGFILNVGEASNSGLGNNRLAPAPILTNQEMTGTIDDESYEVYFAFEGERDELVTLVMEQTRGQLDAYLILATSNFTPLVEDDDSGSGRNARIGNFRLPANGRYVAIATRFNGEAGDSFGDFRLTLERNGNAFAGVPTTVPRLNYNTNIRGEITETTGQQLYAFWGYAGDTVTIRMNRASGTLDPVLELLDRRQRRILRDDSSGSGENALIADYTLDYTGVHYILASRYAGNGKASDTIGTYNLVLIADTD